MARTKSLLTSCEIDIALKAHNCRANKNHRIEKGSKRLKLKIQRSSHYYCIECARKIVKKDIKKLEALINEINII